MAVVVALVPVWASPAAAPDSSLSVGLTGLETWLWYSNPSQVNPIEAIWGRTGERHRVRSAWPGLTESITCNTGEASYEVFASVWVEATGMGGSPDTAAARHVHNRASTSAGYSTGYPVGLDLSGWVSTRRTLRRRSRNAPISPAGIL